MSWADAFIVFVLCCFTAYGLFKGLTPQLAGLAGLFGGLALAILLLGPVVRLIRQRLGPIAGLEGMAFAGIFFLTWLVANLWGATKKARHLREGGSWAEDLGGALAGLANGLFVVAVFIAAFASQDMPLAQNLRASRIGSFVLVVAQRVFFLVSRWMGGLAL